jgi:hypothetical protein
MALFAGGGTSAISDAPAADKWSGPHISLTAHDAFTLGQVGYLNASGEVALADADALATAGALFIALGTIGAHTRGQFLLPGSVIHLHTLAPGWTIGGLVYLSVTAGAMSQTAPVGAGDAIQVLGVAGPANDTLLFHPQLVMVEHG